VRGDGGRSERRAVGRWQMQKGANPSRNARRREPTCILRKGMQTLLEGLHWHLLPHFANEEDYAHAAGVSLRA
jgi:hypothetical protein